MSETSGDYPVYNDGEAVLATTGNGLPPDDPTAGYGFDDDDLDDAEAADDVYPSAAQPAGGAVLSDVDVADLQTRVQAAEDYNRQREAGRVRKKVHGATAASGVGAVVAAIVPMLDSLDLPDGVQKLIMVVIVVITTFFGGYFTKERPAPPGLAA
jgi:hypothetical protein